MAAFMRRAQYFFVASLPRRAGVEAGTDPCVSPAAVVFAAVEGKAAAMRLRTTAHASGKCTTALF